VELKKHYLKRLGYNGPTDVNSRVLSDLHEAHLFAVPFENLDIHFNGIFDLENERLFDKVVVRWRGGFCYELNLLFHLLLIEIGFDSRILKARVYNSEGRPGPEFDHMCLLVKTDQEFLVDVGFGDSFMRPVALDSKIQFDGRNHFFIEAISGGNYDILMSEDGKLFSKKYVFGLEPVLAADFDGACLEKQTSADSHFVRNIICTKPTASGRVTIYNNKFIEHVDGLRHEREIGPQAMMELLRQRFDVVLHTSQRSKNP
jgi:N-hydroxyarylamine O-acetyltransferase